MSQTNEIIVGVDVSKDKLNIYLHPVDIYDEIVNEASAIKKFFLKLKNTYAVKIIVLEPTGGYEKQCTNILNKLELAVHIAHPNQVHHFALSEKISAKTDKIDGKTLALFGDKKQVEASHVKSEEEEESQELIRRKQQLTDFLIKEKMRLSHEHLGKSAKDSLKRFIKQIDREIELLDKKLQENIAKDEEKKEAVALLKTYKGIGDKSALLLILCVPELGHLNRGEIASLIGLAPVNRDSGKKTGYRAIKAGRFHIRKMLYMVALSAIQFNPVMKEFYTRLVAKGKKGKVALTAVMRKILITLNAMLRDKKGFRLASS
jgi:transposase